MRVLAPLTLAAVLGLGLSGCSGADTETASDAPSGTGPTSATSEPDSETPEGDEPGSGEQGSEESDASESVQAESEPDDSSTGSAGPQTPASQGGSEQPSQSPAQSPSESPAQSPSQAPSSNEPQASDSPAPQATGDDRVFPGGTRLRAYRDDPTYPWRVNVLDAEGELVPAMQRVASDLTRMKFEQVIATCESLVTGVSGQQLVRQTRQRFSGPGDISVRQARRLIDLSGQYGCPQ